MSEHTPLWSNQRIDSETDKRAIHLGLSHVDAFINVHHARKLMRQMRQDYEDELATLRARNEELEARIVVGEQQLASCIAERDELWTGYCAAQTRAAELEAQLAAARQPMRVINVPPSEIDLEDEHE
jgi:chromosome segregation ATPase